MAETSFSVLLQAAEPSDLPVSGAATEASWQEILLRKSVSFLLPLLQSFYFFFPETIHLLNVVETDFVVS